MPTYSFHVILDAESQQQAETVLDAALEFLSLDGKQYGYKSEGELNTAE